MMTGDPLQLPALCTEAVKSQAKRLTGSERGSCYSSHVPATASFLLNVLVRAAARMPGISSFP